MNATHFLQNFKQAYDMLKPYNHPISELNKLSLEIAAKLEELELKEREMSLLETKTRQELELSIITIKNQNAQAQAEAIKSLIQAESMLRSVTDNAAINRANAYVGFLNVVGNASQSGAIASHTKNVITEILKIKDADITGLDDALDKLKDAISKLGDNGIGSRDVFIYTPKFEILKGERIKIFGFSSFGNNECVFVIKNKQDEILQEEHTKTITFYSENAGFYEVCFKSKNDKDEFVEDNITIEVREV